MGKFSQSTKASGEDSCLNTGLAFIRQAPYVLFVNRHPNPPKEVSMAQHSVKIINGALDTTPLRPDTLILRGVIDPESLKHLLFDDYQREALPLSSLRKLTDAIKNGSALPDIEIGMRGSRVRNSTDNTYHLQDECFVIDGQQRVNACRNALLQGIGTVHLGAAIHFDTTKEWERERFRILNSEQLK